MKMIARELTNYEDGFLKDKKYLIMDRVVVYVGSNLDPKSGLS
ncbi:hypothetical protein [Novipirellula artificiosorum]|nr:hypothetical protein [Novipirellula artificiosorum]